MRTVRTKIYRFEELSKEAQQVAIINFIDNQEIDMQCFEEHCKEQAEEQGFKDVDVRYSLNCSQGAV